MTGILACKIIYYEEIKKRRTAHLKFDEELIFADCQDRSKYLMGHYSW